MQVRSPRHVKRSPLDIFNLALAALVVTIVFVIVRAVRMTRDQIDRQLRATDPRQRDEIARNLATRIREQADRVRCPRCGGPTHMLLGTDTRYRCEQCQATFEGPPHMPG